MQESATKQTTGRKPLVLALTGSIGSGKSAVSAVLEEAGIPVLDADVSAREAVLPGSPGLQKIRSVFGPGVLAGDGALDRRKMGELVFADPAAKKKLEDILHPLIRERFAAEYKRLRHKFPPPEIIVYVIPLYFEVAAAARYPELEKVIVVAAPREVCLKRIMERDGCSRELAEKKLNSQLPIEEKAQRADYLLDNSGSLAELRRKTLELIQQLRGRK